MTIDLVSPVMQQDPYPAYAKMRRQGTPVPIGHNFGNQPTYFITRYHDALQVLKDPRCVNDGRKLPDWDDWTKRWYIPSALKAFSDSMALADEPDHTRLRSLVHKAFTPNMIQQLEGTIEQMAQGLLDAASHKSKIDLMADFALPLPLNVIADMMGVSQQDREKFHRWMGDTITSISPGDRLGMIPKVLNALGLTRFLKRLVADRRKNPQDDLTTRLVQAEDGGDRLSEAELIAMLMLILFAGHETTVNLIGSGTLALLQHPDQFEKLKADRSLMETAVEEMLRYTNPVQHIAYRYNLEAMAIGGTTIPAHSALQVCVAAANRDESVFENAASLDITRKPNRHIAFGFGIHYCLGAPLARMEARIAFNTLMDRFPDLQLAVPSEQLQWRGMPALRGLTRLPVRLRG